MKYTKRPFIIIVSGPNGAGKTTFYNQLISENIYLSDAVFLNYDNEIAATKQLPEISQQYQDIKQARQDYLLKSKPIATTTTILPFVYKPTTVLSAKLNKFIEQIHYLNFSAAKLASKNMRKKIKDAFADTKNIVFETTSTANRIKKTATKHGYDIYGCHICVTEPELSVSRVQQRVKKGGHDIPKETIYQRYAENIRTLSKVMATETSAIVIDNSNKKPFTPIFGLSQGYIIDISDCPEYLQNTYKNLLKKYKQKSVREIISLEDDIDIKSLTTAQRKTLTQIILLNMLDKIKFQK